jgi:hypothetical protein
MNTDKHGWDADKNQRTKLNAKDAKNAKKKREKEEALYSS